MSGRVLLIDGDGDSLRRMGDQLRAAGYRVSEARNISEARSHLLIEPPQLVISEALLPDGDGLALFDEIHSTRPVLPVILLTASGNIPDAVAATSRGAFDYLTKPFDADVMLEKVKQVLKLVPGAHNESGNAWSGQIVSRSVRMADLLSEARLVAASDASVLIQGESGSGKELLAAVIHRASPRANGPFIAVNCGAIPEQLLESELFGHAQGSSGGNGNGNNGNGEHQGLFQAARGGTLFLDEIADMPLAVQAKLHRVLQERVMRPPNGEGGVPVEVRILSATHEDVDAALAAGRFRSDLYYLLNVVCLTLPALRERREDIPLLASHFLASLAERYRRHVTGFAPDALEALVMADWPGNVRQLHNVVEQVCALATTPLIPLSLVQRALRAPTLQSLTYAQAKQRFERDYLIQLLKLTDGNVSDAAKLADRNRTKFYSLLQRHNLTPSLFRASAAEGMEAQRF
ncbi:MAG TPA: sigma 54-interacting transcriptional regulator [Burkholderiales bacterium]|jgi:two-component system response regulator GlrR|nr:sigma 54-interacting transcriptional regulator [Burkholderiales bacterium]